MAIYFIDSSALVKRYISETGSVWVLGLFDPVLNNEAFIAAITGVEIRTSPFKVSVFRYYFWDRILAVETWGRLEGRVRFSTLLVFFGARRWDAKTTKLTQVAKSRSMLVSSIRFIFAKIFHSEGGIAIIMPR